GEAHPGAGGVRIAAQLQEGRLRTHRHPLGERPSDQVHGPVGHRGQVHRAGGVSGSGGNMSWGAVAGAAVGLVGSAISNRGARRGADAQQQAALAATEEQRRQFDTTRQDLMPWMDAGRGALDQQQAVLRGDYSGFMNSPDYLYARDASLQALDRGAAARGG